MSVSIDDVRNKNKALLMTDVISDEEIEQALFDTKQILKTRLEEEFEYSSNSEVTNTQSFGICHKLKACSHLIRDNYPQDAEALEVAKSYDSEAEKAIKSIINSRELKKDKNISSVKRSRSYKTDSDIRAERFICRIQRDYR